MEDQETIAMEYRHWLKANDSHLREYTPDGIAQLAVACGFPLEIVCPVTTDHVVRLVKRLKFFDSTLQEQWIDLRRYEKGVLFEDGIR